jgi:hypothetical protein
LFHLATTFKENQMKRACVALLACLLPSGLFAFPPSPVAMPLPGMRPRQAGPYLTTEILAVQSELGPQKVGDFDVTGLVALRERLSVAAQKDEYVQKMSMRSFLLPGLGELGTGDTTNGLVFLGADLATLAGTLTAAYLLLPSDLRFDRLDYFGDSLETINDAWLAHTLPDFLPACGALLGGMIVDMTLRQWSSRIARRDAAAAIDRGAVTFTPRIGVGFLGFNVAY